MDLLKQAKEVIDSLEYITIATVGDDGNPWNTPVYAVHDDELHFYWSSWIDAKHSKNIAGNPNVFIVIYDPHREFGTNHRRGVYIQAQASVIDEQQEIKHALSFFNRELSSNEFIGDSIKRIYKATPQKMWLNDKSESQVTTDTQDMRVEVPLHLL